MIDLREHKDLIRSIVKAEDKKDENWKWTVKSISARCIKIRWEYLDYLEEEKNCFEIERVNGSDVCGPALFAITPHAEIVNIYEIGCGQYEHTVENAIECAICAITGYAHSRY